MKQFVVFGLGSFGSAVATTLVELGHEVLAVDNDEEKVDQYKDILTKVVKVDITDEKVLKELGVKSFDAAIVSVGPDLESSILITIMLKEIGVKHVITKANSELHGRVLEKVGSDRVIYPERDEGMRIARSLIMPNVKNQMELSPLYSLIEIAALPVFCEKTLGELDLPGKYGVTLLAIRRGNQFTFSPTAKHTVSENENLILVGENKKIDKLITKFKATEKKN
ncbi:MAG: TrkA family potassium uptake protein [Atribacterota bacterium]|nr:TrkA family potassium uptake protein [Atribacterota bacterium]MDD4895913.1 TrkA family potassium uptake protein [Atribacterota bacterium]